MTKTMKAAVVHGFGRPLTIDDIPIPDPGPGELLVKVIACGVCHTDLHAADGDWPVKPHVPFVPGHEVAGVVAALGPGVKDFKEGDPVGVACCTIAACGANIARPAGRPSASVSATQATLSTADSPNISLPPPTSPRGFHKGTEFAHIAPILCAGVTTYKGLKETHARPGEWVAISGIGGLGHLAIQYAKAMGLHRGHRCCPRKARTGGRCRNSGRCSLGAGD